MYNKGRYPRVDKAGPGLYYITYSMSIGTVTAI